MGLFLSILGAVAFGIARFYVPVSGEFNTKDVYKNLAHIYVGGLFGAGLANKGFDHPYFDPFFMVGIALTILEVVAFVIRRKR